MALGLGFRTSLLSALCMCNKKVHKKLITGRHVVRYTDVDGTTLKARIESEGLADSGQWQGPKGSLAHLERQTV